MNPKHLAALRRRLWPLVLACLLSACAGTQAFREGNTLLASGSLEAGLAKLAEASRLEPKNIEYRIAYIDRKLAVINSLNTQAEAARQQGGLSNAEKLYQRALQIDPNNSFARQGLDSLVIERRHRLLVEEAEQLFKQGGPSAPTDALEKLRPVLQENPGQREALNLKARIVELQSKQAPSEVKLGAAFRKPITLEFREAPLRSIFDGIAKISGLNFFFDKDIRPDIKATIFAKQTSIEDAIRLLLVTNQLEQTVLNANSILIYPNTPQKLKDYQALTVRSFYLANADVKAVAKTIKTILKTKDMEVDERLGLIIMRDTPEAIRMAERIVALQDLNDPEVMLDVEVLEIKRSRLMNLGVRWPDQVGLSLSQLTTTTSDNGTSTTTGTPLTLDSLRKINSGKINVAVGNVTLNATKEDADTNILSNPRIRVRNKEKAKILIGDRVPVITTTSTSTGFISDSVSYVDVGLKLEVEPNVYLDEEVAIKINLEVSNVVKEVTSKSGTLAYQIGTRNASTILRLKDGETQVLAGLISNEERSTADKIPGIGDLPVLSRLFGNQNDDNERSEIVLSITPHVIRSIRRPDLALGEFASGTESNIGGRGLVLSNVEPEPKPADAKGGESKAEAKAGEAKAVPGVVVPSAALAPATGGKAGAGGAEVLAVATPSSTAAAPRSTPASTGGPVSLNWQGPAQVKAGDQFSAVLQVNSQGALRGLPLLIGFDPAVLQVASVLEGGFLKQANGQTTFSSRIDAAQGKVFVAAVRQNPSGTDAGINGSGSVVTVNFKAIKAAAATKVQLLSVTPEPLPASPVALPPDFSLKVQ